MTEPEADRTLEDEARLVELMVAYQAGELQAFTALHRTLADALTRYIVSVTRDAALAQDLVQETFLEIHRSRRTYLPPLPVRPWVFGVARNVLRRHRRSIAMRLRAQEHDAERRRADAAPGVRPVVSARDVEEALQQLPPTRRDVWRLHHVHGLSFREIAARLGIGEGAAKLRSSRAMTTLRALLGIDRGGRHE
jgi:RNA polymerase sigma-70 factor, ECF subfamily